MRQLEPIIDTLRAQWHYQIQVENIASQLELYIPTMLGHAENVELEHRKNGLEDLLRFLENEKHLMLLLGDSGSGKSLFGQWLVNYIWEQQKSGWIPTWIKNRIWGQTADWIPIFIHLPTQKIKKGFFEKYLKKRFEFSMNDIQVLKENTKILLFLDAYDEMKVEFRGKNLYQLGELYQWKNLKVIISCRTEALVNYSLGQQQIMFVPYQNAEMPLNFEWEKRYVQFFDPNTQIPRYIELWKKRNAELIDNELNYLEVMNRLPGLSEMITNPFILWIVMAALPRLLKHYKAQPMLEQYHLTRLGLFDTFTTAWFERQREKLLRNELIDNIWAATIIDDYKCYCQ